MRGLNWLFKRTIKRGRNVDGSETRNISFGNDLIIRAIKMKWLTRWLLLDRWRSAPHSDVLL